MDIGNQLSTTTAAEYEAALDRLESCDFMTDEFLVIWGSLILSLSLKKCLLPILHIMNVCRTMNA